MLQFHFSCQYCNEINKTKVNYIPVVSISSWRGRPDWLSVEVHWMNGSAMVRGMFVNIARLINASLKAVGRLTHVTAVSHAAIVTALRLSIVAVPTVVMPTVVVCPDDMLAAAWSTVIVVTAAGFVGRRRHAAR